MEGFISRLKSALAVGPQAPLVFVGNFEVERQWAVGEPGLPQISFAASDAVVNRMDELAVLLADEDDHVVLKEAPDPGFLGYLGELGIGLPHVVNAGLASSVATVTEDALRSARVRQTLAALAAAGAHLVPHGVSEREERLAEWSGLPLAGPPAWVCKAVNSKIYSREIADQVGLRQPQGWPCRTVEDLSRAVAHARELLADGRPVVVKDAFGVSGKGIMVCRTEQRLDNLWRMVVHRADRSGRDAVGLVVEEWVAKRADLNYQFTLGRDGAVRFDFVKEAITENGVHRGHHIPARIPPGQVAELADAARRLGGRLSRDGYYGVVGVDALVDGDGALYPVIEINARNNMSTYQLRLEEQFVGEGKVALARHYPLAGPRPFATVRQALGPALFEGGTGAGFLINDYATTAGPSGRLYGMIIANSEDDLSARDEEISARLAGGCHD